MFHPCSPLQETRILLLHILFDSGQEGPDCRMMALEQRLQAMMQTLNGICGTSDTVYSCSILVSNVYRKLSGSVGLSTPTKTTAADVCMFEISDQFIDWSISCGVVSTSNSNASGTSSGGTNADCDGSIYKM